VDFLGLSCGRLTGDEPIDYQCGYTGKKAEKGEPMRTVPVLIYVLRGSRLTVTLSRVGSGQGVNSISEEKHIGFLQTLQKWSKKKLLVFFTGIYK
jgi:hypothetical protein